MSAMQACDRCGSPDELEARTLLDDSGGATVRLCSECRASVRRERCHFCGGSIRATAKADGVLFPEEERVAPICDGCRDRIIHGRVVA